MMAGCSKLNADSTTEGLDIGRGTSKIIKSERSLPFPSMLANLCFQRVSVCE